MAFEVKMPQLGLTMEEGTVTKWVKQEGDTVKAGDVILEITTDKLTSEVESEHDGVLLKIVAQEGEDIPVKGLLAYIGEAGEQVGDAPAAKAEAPAAEAAARARSSTCSTCCTCGRRQNQNFPSGKENSGKAGGRLYNGGRFRPSGQNRAEGYSGGSRSCKSRTCARSTGGSRKGSTEENRTGTDGWRRGCKAGRDEKGRFRKNDKIRTGNPYRYAECPH